VTISWLGANASALGSKPGTGRQNASYVQTQRPDAVIDAIREAIARS
jgi:hypothetical protein